MARKTARKTIRRTARPRGTTPLYRPSRDSDAGAFDWDPSRPLSEQWPWSGDRASAIPADAPETDDAVWNAMTEEQRIDIHRLNASVSDPAALLASVRECTPAELEAEQPPADIAAAVERIAEVADGPSEEQR